MKYLSFVCRMLVIALALTIGLTQYRGVHADSVYTLSGRVTDQLGNPLLETAIMVTTLDTGTTVAATSTDASGMYSLSIEAGTYNIAVMPPAGSGLGSAVALGRVLNNDTTMDFVLVPAGAVTLSGWVLDTLGNRLPNQRICLSVCSSTDANGHYSFSVSPGEYDLALTGSNNNAVNLNAPTEYSIQNRADHRISLTSSTVMDLVLPVKRVNVHVQYPNGSPAAGVKVSNNHVWNHSLMLGTISAYGYSYYSVYSPAITDEAGNATLWLFPTDGDNTYTFTASPPAGSGFVTTLFTGITITTDTTIPLTLGTPITLSGRLLDTLGNGLPNQSLCLYSWSSWCSFTDTEGHYAFTILAGDYDIGIGSEKNPVNLNIPTNYSIQNLPDHRLSLTQSTVLDIVLPLKRVDVHVQDPDGNPVAGVKLSTNSLWNYSLTLSELPAYAYSYYSSPGPSTDESGNATLWLFPPDSDNTYTISATPPAGSRFAAASLDGITFTSDTEVMITLPVTVTVSGRVLDTLGNGLPNQYICISYLCSTTDNNGNYNINVLPGEYDIQISGGYDPAYLNAPLNAPTQYSIQNLAGHRISLTQNTFMDFVLPVKRVDIHVQDPAGNPVAGVKLSAFNSWYNYSLNLGTIPAYGHSSYNYPAITDESGNVTLWLFPTDNSNTYLLYVVPPADSGFLNTSLDDITFTTDTAVTVTLEAPVTLSGRVLDTLGNGLPDQYVCLCSWTSWCSTTDTSGNYVVTILPGEYDIQLSGNTGPAYLNVPRSYLIQNLTDHRISLAQSTVMDFILPVKRVDIHVQDPAGNPVSGVKLSTNYLTNNSLMLGTIPAYGYNYYHSQYSPAITDESGNTTLWLFPTDSVLYTFQAFPPVESPFATFNISNYPLQADKSLVIAMQFAHDPPETTALLSPQPNASDEYPAPTTVSLSAVSAPGYTIAATFYKVDGGEQQTYTAPFTVSAGGSHTLQYWSVDNFGVFELSRTLNFKIVTNQPPLLEPIVNQNVPWGNQLTFTAKASDLDIPTQALTFSLKSAPAGASITTGGSFTWTPSSDQIGDTTVEVCVSDGTTSTCKSVNITVEKRPTQLVYSGHSSGQFSDPVTLKATLTDDGGGTLQGTSLVGRSVTFVIGSQSATISTISGGLAQTTLILNQAAGTPGVTSTFLGDPLYLPADDSSELTVEKEITTLEYTGDTLKATSSTPNADTVNINLAAVIKEATDDHIGNKLDATQVRFSVYKGTNTTMITPDTSCTANITVTGIGVGITNCSMNLTVDNYAVKMELLPNGFYTAPFEDTVVTVVTAGTGFSTGGGWVTEPRLGTRSNFGFTVKYNKNGNVQGNSIYIYRMTTDLSKLVSGAPAGLREYNWIIKSNATTALIQSCTKTLPKVCSAIFTGKNNIMAVDRVTGIAYSLGGNYQFQVDVTDKGEPGSGATPDTYAIRVWNGIGTYYQLGVPKSPIALNGGNIQIKP